MKVSALRSIFGRRGFLWIPRGDGNEALAGPGALLRPSVAPLLVVNHALEDVIVTSWPGRLVRAAVTKRAPDQVRGAGYTRALEVRVLEEFPPHALFGPQGDAVVRVIERVSTLDLLGATTLADARVAETRELGNEAFGRWMRRRSDSGPGPREPFGRVSPVGGALLVLSCQVHDRAQAVSGAAALVWTDDEQELAEPWSGALSALRDAVLAEGRPDLFTPPEREQLLVPYAKALGPA